MKRSLAVLLMLVMGSIPAWAALGDDVSSVISDQNAMHGQIRKEVRAGYNLHQITTSDGSVVNEFVSPAGKVFGVSWQGHSMPDLQQLMGSYAPQLQQGPRTRVIPRRGVTIQADDFVFSSFGRMRSFRGHAYVPSLVPGNVTAEVVQ
jgi:hypothetical protein